MRMRRRWLRHHLVAAWLLLLLSDECDVCQLPSSVRVSVCLVCECVRGFGL